MRRGEGYIKAEVLCITPCLVKNWRARHAEARRAKAEASNGETPHFLGFQAGLAQRQSSSFVNCGSSVRSRQPAPFCFAIRRGYLRRAASLLGHIPQYAPSRRLARRGVPHPNGFAKGACMLCRALLDAHSVEHVSALPRSLPSQNATSAQTASQKRCKILLCKRVCLPCPFVVARLVTPKPWRRRITYLSMLPRAALPVAASRIQMASQKACVCFAAPVGTRGPTAPAVFYSISTFSPYKSVPIRTAPQIAPCASVRPPACAPLSRRSPQGEGGSAISSFTFHHLPCPLKSKSVKEKYFVY